VSHAPISRAADAIERFIAGLDLQTYEQSEIIHSAVERKFEIIGESLNQLAKQDPALASRIPRIHEIIRIPKSSDPRVCLRRRTCPRIADRARRAARAPVNHRGFDQRIGRLERVNGFLKTCLHPE